MKIIPLHPSSVLSPLIWQMWIIEEEAGTNIDITSFPTGYPYINVVSGNPFVIKNGQKDPIEVRSYLAGQVLNPFVLSMKLIRRALIIRLQPYAVPFLFHRPAADMAGDIIPLDAIDRWLACELEDLMNSELTSQEVLLRTEEIFGRRLKEDNYDQRLLHSLRYILDRGGDVDMRSMAEESNLSQRRIQQLYRHYLGLTAKAFSRVVKVQNYTLKILNGKSMEQVIPESYHDQAHFIHDLKGLTHMTPTEYFRYITDPARRDAYRMSNLYNVHRY